MTAAAVQHAPGRSWLSIVILLHRGERGIDATHRSVKAEGDGVLEITALASSPDGTTLDIARRHSDRLRPPLHVRPNSVNQQARTSFAIAAPTAMDNWSLHGFNLRMGTVVIRHMPRLSLQGWAAEHAACASIAVHAALDAAALGNLRRSSDALAPSLHLKPGGLGLHVRHSLIVKRVALRPRPKLCGA